MYTVLLNDFGCEEWMWAIIVYSGKIKTPHLHYHCDNDDEALEQVNILLARYPDCKLIFRTYEKK